MNAPTRFKWSVIAFLVVGMLSRRRVVTEKTIAVAPLGEIAGAKRRGTVPAMVVHGRQKVKGSFAAPHAIRRNKCG